MVDWTAWTSEVLPEPGGFWEELLEPLFETDFCLEEYFVWVWYNEPITPSIGGVACDFDVAGLDDGCETSGNNSYKVPGRE